MQDLLDNPNTKDEELAAIADGNDIPILEAVINNLELLEKDKRRCYNLLKDEDGLMLQEEGRPYDETQHFLFSFLAKDYNEAGSIMNKFMDWSQYIPMPEHIATKRTLTLFDEHKEPIADVDVFFYQPQELDDITSSCEFHININHKNPTGIGWKNKTESLGAKNIAGVDSTQALLLAMRTAEVIIECYNNDNKNKIYWLEYGQKAMLLHLGNITLDENNL